MDLAGNNDWLKTNLNERQQAAINDDLIEAITAGSLADVKRFSSHAFCSRDR